MQPWLDKFPGMTMGPWGTNFERTNTWWEQSRAWMQYLSRCQALLQDGHFVADACYYYGQGAPNTITTERSAPLRHPCRTATTSTAAIPTY